MHQQARLVMDSLRSGKPTYLVQSRSYVVTRLDVNNSSEHVFVLRRMSQPTRRHVVLAVLTVSVANLAMSYSFVL